MATRVKTRIYPVGDLVCPTRLQRMDVWFSTRFLPDSATWDAGKRTDTARGSSDGETVEFEADPDTIEEPKAPRQRMDDLMYLVRNTIEPTVWTHDNGGWLRSHRSDLIVVREVEIHDVTEAFLAKSRKGGTVSMSVACGSGWLGKGDDPNKNTPEANTGAYGRHNTFDFDLKTGRARLLPVIPLTARDGGVKLLVWLPKTPGK